MSSFYNIYYLIFNEALLLLYRRGKLMELIIGGDLVPTKSNEKNFLNADIDTLLGQNLLSVWNSADYRLFNLEVPLTDKKTPISKCGPNLIAPTKTANGIKALNPSLLTLANNHILDQGEQGLKSTMELLKENAIPFVGAGERLYEASKPFIYQHEGKSIGIYACAENEFTIATEQTPGANPFDPFESLDHIKSLKDECDYVIVLYHGGKEHYRYPSPYLKKVCRKMAQKGADLIICQHSHCIGCYENFEDSTIIYGQGNFLFDYSENELWQTSLLIKITLNNGINLEYIPIVKTGNSVRLAEDKEAAKILRGFHQRSADILKDGFIDTKYQEFASANVESYLKRFSGFGRFISAIDRRFLNGLLLKRKYNTNKLLEIQNYIECEAHRELVIKGLSNLIKEKSR
jgi:poly-gamma-glutamate capsule biosynthesis protein CapA/YwtB (metallophosphatase superfamily)